MGGISGAAGAAPGGAVAGAPVAAAGGGGLQGLLSKFKTLGPALMSGAQTPEADQFLTNIARTGPPPPVQPIAFEGGVSPGQAIGKALQPPGRGILPAPRRLPMMRGEALTQPQGIGGALTGRY